MRSPIRCRHEDTAKFGNHKHLSKSERNVCEKRIFPLYGVLMHANVIVKSSLIPDWIIAKTGISFNADDPTTFGRVIEYHPHAHHVSRKRQQRALELYRERRTEALRKLGITCPIEIILK